mmetsp:Transcript_8963/g.31221  ORF Transcript_8963/g.31221 Transcript_8963/m.31221 type:complete len:220 (-) Transcript_8963:1344-2003(-)
MPSTPLAPSRRVSCCAFAKMMCACSSVIAPSRSMASLSSWSHASMSIAGGPATSSSPLLFFLRFADGCLCVLAYFLNMYSSSWWNWLKTNCVSSDAHSFRNASRSVRLACCFRWSISLCSRSPSAMLSGYFAAATRTIASENSAGTSSLALFSSLSSSVLACRKMMSTALACRPTLRPAPLSVLAASSISLASRANRANSAELIVTVLPAPWWSDELTL